MTLPQRPLRGSRISSFYPVKSLPSLSSLDSAFQLQEYISLLIRLDVHDVESIVSLPGKRKEAGEDGSGKAEDADADKAGNEIMVDEPCWIYEQLRRLAQDLTHPLINMLQQECTRSTCPEMKAGEWLYLCVAHGNDGALEQCCAIDYILHTLDSATALLNTPRAFPSRLQIPASSHRHFGSLARRLGRIFAHAYFHHREAFEQAEAESSLYARFLALTLKFELVPPEFMVIPPRPAHGTDSDDEDNRSARNPPPPPSVNPTSADLHPAASEAAQPADEGQWDISRGLSPKITTDVGDQRGNSPLSAGIDSPRKMGRNRTDTMVLNEAYAIAEELSKANGNGEQKKRDVEKDLDSFTLLTRQEPEASTSSQAEADVTSVSPPEVPTIPDQELQTSPTSEEHSDSAPEPTPSTTLPESDLSEVPAANAAENDKVDSEPVLDETPAPATEPAPEAAPEEPSSAPPEEPQPTETEPPTTVDTGTPDETPSPAGSSEPEPTVSAADEVPDSPVVPKEELEEVPSEVSPTAEEETKGAEPVTQAPEVKEEKVESEMKELVEGKTDAKDEEGKESVEAEGEKKSDAV